MERMIEAENNDAIGTFQWSSQLRYYYNKDNKGVTVKVRKPVINSAPVVRQHV
jgi:hypothetical protein